MISIRALTRWTVPTFVCALTLLAGCTRGPHKPPGPIVPVFQDIELKKVNTADERSIHIAVPSAPVFSRVPENELPPVIVPETVAGEGYRLGVEDVLDISVYGEENLQHIEVPVRPDGRISFAFIGDVSAEGRTVEEIRADMTARLERYLRSPEIMVIVKQFAQKKVFVGGEVKNPGVYFLGSREGTLLDALYKVGLVSEHADLESAYLIRENRLVAANFKDLVRGEMTQNILLRDQDLVYVPKARGRHVYVLGEVRTSQAIQVDDAIPFVEVLARSGGLIRGAAQNEVAVIRGGLHNPMIAVVNVKALLAGDMRQNIAIEPGDIVYAPKSALGKYLDVLDLILRSISPIVQGVIVSENINNP